MNVYVCTYGCTIVCTTYVCSFLESVARADNSLFYWMAKGNGKRQASLIDQWVEKNIVAQDFPNPRGIGKVTGDSTKCNLGDLQ